MSNLFAAYEELIREEAKRLSEVGHGALMSPTVAGWSSRLQTPPPQVIPGGVQPPPEGSARVDPPGSKIVQIGSVTLLSDQDLLRMQGDRAEFERFCQTRYKRLLDKVEGMAGLKPLWPASVSVWSSAYDVNSRKTTIRINQNWLFIPTGGTP